MVNDAGSFRAGADELQARRARVGEAIGAGALALVAAGPFTRRSMRFRQTNEFFYLTGLEVPGAYVLVEGAEGVHGCLPVFRARDRCAPHAGKRTIS